MTAQKDRTPGFDDVVAAAAFLGDAVMRTPVIRSPQLDAIAATPGVDGLFVGPGDLGLRLKHHDGDIHALI